MKQFEDVQAVLTDIEGTTSSLSFVRDVLFPYARARLPQYVRAHEAALASILAEVRTIEKNPGLSAQECVSIFLRWVDEDKKITPLKTLQGMIWKEGYERGELRGHVYKDAANALRRWREAGLRLYVYSSGSVAAQKLLFAHTDYGDMTPLFSGYFDTSAGPKLEAGSYTKIAAEIKTPPGAVLFLSDHAGELKAAVEAGFEAVLLDREGAASPAFRTAYRTARNFDDIMVREMAA